jgi:hypothetical protein
MRVFTACFGIGCVVLVGCGGAQDGAAPPPPHTIVENPSPLVAVPVGNGQTIEFYDLNGLSVVTETGPAGAARLAMGDATPRRPADLFRSLRPDLPVPEALLSLQAKAALQPEPALPRPTRGVAPVAGGGTYPDGAGTTTSGDPAGVSTKTSALLEGCNNGCCDRQWLTTVGCGWTGYDSSWWQFDYGWSTVSFGGDNYFRDNVCSASGTSRWSLTVCTNGCVLYTWDIPEATYRYQWGWTDSLFFEYSVYSAVNSQAAMHLHNHCGVATDDD